MIENPLIYLLLVTATVTACSDKEKEEFEGFDNHDKWIKEIKNEQIANRKNILAFNEFQFEDRRLKSGIDFKHQTMIGLFKMGRLGFYSPPEWPRHC